jgi:hypothetical protein
LQSQVDQLAESLSLELTEERDYVQILRNANAQMSAIGEEIAGDAASAAREDRVYKDLLAHSNELTDAMQTFLKAGSAEAEEVDGKRWAGKHAAHTDDKFVRQPVTDQFAECKDGSALARKLLVAASRCRKRRQELSLLLLEPNVYDIHADTDGELASQQARESLGRACTMLEGDEVMLVSMGGGRVAAILMNCDRPAALSVANHAISELSRSNGHINREMFDPATTVSVGVATASVVPRNFDAHQLIDSATRCLSAARTCGISTVKSIEV